jgi:hypothetical protein
VQVRRLVKTLKSGLALLAGRRINDGIAAFVANDVIKTVLKRKQYRPCPHLGAFRSGCRAQPPGNLAGQYMDGV